jgi:hypothetical protein
LNRFTDDAEAADACGSNKGLTVKTRCIRPIREPISLVLRRGINGFQKVSRHQGLSRNFTETPATDAAGSATAMGQFE